ncbi:MAG TPA: FG-GAP-like repeat-containing protein [Polyangiaceae bacterium]
MRICNPYFLFICGISGLLGCSAGEGAADDESFDSRSAAAVSCPIRKPPPVECTQLYCNLNDLAWEDRPLRAGTPCGANGQCDGQGSCVLPPPPTTQPSDRVFFISGLGDRCVDFGERASWSPGAPVTLQRCAPGAAQRVRIKEIDLTTHDVELRVESEYCLGVRGGIVSVGEPLELQPCSGNAAQRFALDGDAILVGAQASGKVSRELVIEPKQSRTAAGTPLVVAARDVSDAEYFRFRAEDGSAARPTSGFIQVSDTPSLLWAIGRGWGTVVEVDERWPLNLSITAPVEIPAGVTLRGYRKGMNWGAQIVSRGNNVKSAFLIMQPNVRVTGLRLRGAADVTDGKTGVSGIEVYGQPPGAGILLDHLDVGYFTGSAIDVRGGDETYSLVCPGPGQVPAYGNPSVRAIGNFLHHNDIYGVVTGSGAFAEARANVMYENDHHDVACDGRGNSGYVAYDNLSLSASGGGHRFDVHGRLHPTHWYGGIAGDYFDIAHNTILETEEESLKVRGTPCRFVSFHDNVVKRAMVLAVSSMSEDDSRVVYWPNEFDAPDPMSELAVGDFDGDGTEDVFVGTGASWYFSSGGKNEWRFLNRMPEHARALRFGDFDGDRRTDVVALHGTRIDISWAGSSAWHTLNTTSLSVEDLAVGDFDADGLSDLFATTGSEWLFAPAGLVWQHFATSTQRAPSLKFGDFTGDQRTDVLASSQGAWMIVAGVGQSFAFWSAPAGPSLSAFVVADFNGDGISDLAGPIGGAWAFASGGRGGWTLLRATHDGLAGKLVGRFDENAIADVVTWNDKHFDYFSGGRDPQIRWSAQMMK